MTLGGWVDGGWAVRSCTAAAPVPAAPRPAHPFAPKRAGMLLRNYAAEYLIGKVEGAPPPFKPGGQPAAEQPSAAAEGEQREASEEDAPALRKGRLLKARMTEKEVITHDTRRFRFALPKEARGLGARSVCSCLCDACQTCSAQLAWLAQKPALSYSLLGPMPCTPTLFLTPCLPAGPAAGAAGGPPHHHRRAGEEGMLQRDMTLQPGTQCLPYRHLTLQIKGEKVVRPYTPGAGAQPRSAHPDAPWGGPPCHGSHRPTRAMPCLALPCSHAGPRARLLRPGHQGKGAASALSQHVTALL